MPTGAASGRLAVDVDPRNGGDHSLDELRAKRGQLPKTAEQITGGGGRHFIYRYGGGAVPKNLALGIDLKGDGGYIVLAPSIHASGNRYRWDGVDGRKAILDPAEAPQWLTEYITAARNGGLAEGKAAAGDKWKEGERNDKLTSMAGSMRRRGASREAMEAALLEENRQRCDPRLQEVEVRRIAENVASYDPDAGRNGAPARTHRRSGLLMIRCSTSIPTRTKNHCRSVAGSK
jgi:putative DNA primase/helicase